MHQQICGGESTLADAITDRISHDSYKVDVKNADPSRDIRRISNVVFSIVTASSKITLKNY
jgi:hypothetical protein